MFKGQSSSRGCVAPWGVHSEPVWTGLNQFNSTLLYCSPRWPLLSSLVRTGLIQFSSAIKIYYSPAPPRAPPRAPPSARLPVRSTWSDRYPLPPTVPAHCWVAERRGCCWWCSPCDWPAGRWRRWGFGWWRVPGGSETPRSVERQGSSQSPWSVRGWSGGQKAEPVSLAETRTCVRVLEL